MKIPVTAVIATKDRPEKLANLFASLRAQELALAEMVVVDASRDARTRELCAAAGGAAGRCVHRCAEKVGAASQRNEGVAASTQPFILFADDDVVLEPGCLRALWDAISGDPGLGGVNAVITNQEYHAPGRVSGAFYAWLNGARLPSYAGRCIGPGLNFLPDSRDDLPEVSPVDWLNLGVTLYRREALPDPPFHPHFIGYSLGEDLALSLTVARKWRLASARKARIFHDTGAGRGRLGVARGAAMELVNRHFIMTRIRGMKRFGDYSRLVAWELFSIASGLRSASGWARLPAVVWGKLRGIFRILGAGNGARGQG
ncbi:MAG TPA: glycosyltransferase family 2 protein [Verrucomicrobiae bacterium]|nr:glycosyltransferase family 2 protein [Verrucomicrobiae bacterium]